MKQRLILFILSLFTLVTSCVLMAGRLGAVEASSHLQVWGEPCPKIHDPPCYQGSNGGSSNQGLGLSATGAYAFSSQPLAVEMLCFDAQGQDQQVMIEWETATEFDTYGFYLERAEQVNGTFENISGLIPHCDSGGVIGGYYIFTDLDVSNGNTYYYRLKEMLGGSQYNMYPEQGSIPAVPSSATATPSRTPTPTPTNTPVTPSGSEESDLPTDTPTPTVTSSPGPSPTSSSTPSPTSIGAPTATPSPSPTAARGSTFTPTPAGPAPANTRLPTATRRLTSASSGGSGNATGATTDSETLGPTHTPLALAQAGTPDPDSGYPRPLLEPQLDSAGTSYPGPAVDPPTAAPFPTDYAPPAAGPSFQLATMTPAGASSSTDSTGEQGSSADADTVPRLWLYGGFAASLLALAAGLAAMLRRGQKPAALQTTELEPDDLDGDPSD